MIDELDRRRETIENIIRRFKSELMEHCDSVQVNCTVHDGASGNTFAIDSGSGNFYSRLGAIKEWLTKQDEIVRDHARHGCDSPEV